MRLSTLSLENINCISLGKGLLDNGDDFVLTALLCAAEDGDMKNLKDLLQITSLDLNKGNKNRETALHMAASSGRLEIIKLLHEHKIDLHAQDNNGENSIHYCCRSNNVDAAKQCVDYLLKHGVSLNVQNKNGEPALHIATRYGCTELVKYLCEMGAHIDLQDDQDESAMHVAAWHGFPEIIRILCHYESDVNLRNGEGETALIIASARGYSDIVKILIEHKADLNARDKRGNLALHWAVKRHYTVIALLLIQAECNMDAVDFNGETALHIACRENLLIVVQTLCALGCRVDIKNKREMTPLHTATEKNEIDAVRCLCLAGLDLNLTNKDGETAEQMALGLKHNSIANLLSSLRRQENREIYIEQLVPTQEFLRCVKIKLFGSSGVGKSTLIGSLKCSYLGSFFRKTRLSSKSSSSAWKNRSFIQSRTSLDKSVDGSGASGDLMQRSVLDNFDVSNDKYTKGIDISNVTFTNTSHFSLWEFSGYEPYQTFYDYFIGDHNCIHFLVFSLENNEFDSLGELIYWLEFLKARLPPKDGHFGHKGKYLNTLTIVLIATHVDCDKTATKNEDGEYVSEKATRVYKHILNAYKNEFDISDKHFCIDARSAWVPELKNLMQYCNKLKEIIVAQLPRCTMFLSRSLYNVQNWRKLNPQYPIIGWKKFVEMIREKVNPLASDEHLKEIIQQLQLMGEVVYIQSDNDQDLVCLDPNWLCHTILGTFFSHERFNNTTHNADGCFSIDELGHIFNDTCSDVKRLKDILLALDLCCEKGDSYEFPCVNFTDNWNYSWTKAAEGFVQSGLQIKCSNHLKTLIGCLFSRIQVHLRRVVNKSYDFVDPLKEETSVELLLESQDKLGNLDMSRSSLKNNRNSFTRNSTSSSLNKPLMSAFYDIELTQWRYGSLLRRAKSKIECLITMDARGQYIEIRARAANGKREELFYFIQETQSLIEQVLNESCPGLNLESHYLSPNFTHTYTQKQVYQSMLDGKMTLTNPHTQQKEKLLDIICCGSEQIFKNLIFGCDLSVSEGIGLYTKRVLSRLLDDIDPMGRDWCLLAVILGLQDQLPILDSKNDANLSKTNYLIDIWSKSKQNVSARLFIDKLNELDRRDVVDLVMSTSILYKLSMIDDSGIRNSSQTLASTK